MKLKLKKNLKEDKIYKVWKQSQIMFDISCSRDCSGQSYLPIVKWYIPYF